MAAPKGSEPLEARVRATIVYALPDRSYSIEVEVTADSTLADVVNVSGLRQREPFLPQELDLGVFGRPQPNTTKVRNGDRIEVYRPLTVDPKEARRIRAEVKRRRTAAAR
jgi:putative ubiquitin-RnfH superfamily antitoxin RatB of RatAB toxin-antitoxin module